MSDCTPLLPQRTLGRSNVAVSQLGIGTAAVGNLYQPMSDASARATLDTAFDAGITYADTAPYYGFGLSERRVGDAVRGHGGITLSTKVGRLLKPATRIRGESERHGFYSSMPFEPVFDYSRDAILRSHEDSLQRLGVARIDILYVHDIGRLTHGERDRHHFDALTRGGGLRALAELRASGTVGAIGIGVNEVEACLRVMDHVRLDAILLAGRYTLLDQTPLDTLFPRCWNDGTSIVVGGPYNSGILATGVLQSGGGHFDYAAAPAAIVERVARIETICRRHEVPLAAAALQFALAHPTVASVIPGIDSAARVAETVALYRTPIPAELWTDLRSEQLIDSAAPVPGE